MARCLNCDAPIPSVEDYCSQLCKRAYETQHPPTASIPNPFEPEETEEERTNRVGEMIRINTDRRLWLEKHKDADAIFYETGTMIPIRAEYYAPGQRRRV